MLPVLIVICVFLRFSEQLPIEESKAAEKWMSFYCNKPSVIKAKDELLSESILKSNNLNLTRVAVVIRHGDRGPAEAVNGFSEMNCDPIKNGQVSNSENTPDLAELYNRYRTLLLKIKNRLNSDISYDLLPESVCRDDRQLTVIGALQHLTLGRQLRSTYEKYYGRQKLGALTTNYPRTFQSGLALLFGYVDPQNEIELTNYPNLNLTYDSFFCRNSDKSSCPSKGKEAESIENEIEIMDLKTLETNPELNDLVDLIRKSVYPTSEEEKNRFFWLNWDSKTLEGALAYLCHGSTLPCNSDDCPSLNDVYNYVKLIEIEMERLSQSKIWKDLNWLRAGNFLNDLAINMNKRRYGSTDFNLFSGHDSTVVSIGSILGFFHGVLPPYASRIVFEGYTHVADTGTSSNFLRIIYNGNDVSHDTFVCRDSPTSCLSLNSSNGQSFKLISLDSLIEFVRKEMKKVN